MQTEALTPLVTAVGSSLGLTLSAGWLTGRWGYNSTVTNYMEMLRQPWIAAAAKTRIYLMLSYLQDYKHEDAAIEREVRSQLKNLNSGTKSRLREAFRTHQSKMASAIYCGFSITEQWHAIEGKKAKIAGLNGVDPRHIKFSLDKNGELEIRFKKADLDVGLQDIIHIKNEDCFNLSNNPAGVATLDRAVPFWEQYRLVMLSMAIAAQRQATPLLVGKTNAGTETAAKVMLEKLEAARNSGVMVIDALDDIAAIAQQTDGAFFVSVLRILRQGVLMSFLIPETILGQGESGSGDSNLNAGHTQILRMTSRTEAGIFGEELVSQMVRPVLEFNYGDLEDWGSFPLTQNEPEDPNGLITALTKSVEAAVSDSDRAAARIAELAGL